MNYNELWRSMIKKKRRGRIRISFDVLAELLGLDSSHEIIEVYRDHKDFGSDTFSVIIKGLKMPLNNEGDEIYTIHELPK